MIYAKKVLVFWLRSVNFLKAKELHGPAKCCKRIRILLKKRTDPPKPCWHKIGNDFFFYHRSKWRARIIVPVHSSRRAATRAATANSCIRLNSPSFVSRATDRAARFLVRSGALPLRNSIFTCLTSPSVTGGSYFNNSANSPYNLTKF